MIKNTSPNYGEEKREAEGPTVDMEKMWIRIRTGYDRLDPDPDPGGQKWPTRIVISEKLSYFEGLDVLFCLF